MFLETCIIFLRVEKTVDAFKSKIFLTKSERKGEGILNPDHSKLKVLTPKQMLQRLPIAHVKAGNNSVSLLNEIRQIVYSLYQSKQITKKVYN